jgi:hypothetical protein
MTSLPEARSPLTRSLNIYEDVAALIIEDASIVRNNPRIVATQRSQHTNPKRERGDCRIVAYSCVMIADP